MSTEQNRHRVTAPGVDPTIAAIVLEREYLRSELTALRAQLEKTEQLRFGADATRRQQRVDIDRFRAQLADARRERDELIEERDGGVHTCHDNCQRPACKFRRERDQWRAVATRLKEAFEHCERRYVTIQQQGALADFERLNKSP
jgi:hypothetical protein